MKKFDDFVASLTEEDFIRIGDSFSGTLSVYGKNIPEILNSMFNASTSASVIYSLELLRLYHDWLHTES